MPDEAVRSTTGSRCPGAHNRFPGRAGRSLARTGSPAAPRWRHRSQGLSRRRRPRHARARRPEASARCRTSGDHSMGNARSIEARPRIHPGSAGRSVRPLVDPRREDELAARAERRVRDGVPVDDDRPARPQAVSRRRQRAAFGLQSFVVRQWTSRTRHPPDRSKQHISGAGIRAPSTMLPLDRISTSDRSSGIAEPSSSEPSYSARTMASPTIRAA